VNTMMTESERRAIGLYPELQRLLDIRGMGWTFQLVTDEAGMVTAVKGLFMYRVGLVHWADMLQIHNSADTAGVRLNPDRQPVWQMTGTMIDLIDGLIQLPHPSSPFAPRLVLGKLASLWVPSRLGS
jgi:hypothetical protein